MKRLSLLVTSLFISLYLSAQVRVAMVGGGHKAEIIEENDLPGWDTTRNNFTGRTGIHFGFIADLPFSAKSHFSFQPGVMISNKGRKYTQVFDTLTSNTWTIKSNEFLNYIDIPLNLVYKISLGKKTRFILGAGPYLSFFYSGKLKTETYTKRGIYTATESEPQVSDGIGRYSTLDYGADGLAGFEFGRIFITANYSRGLKDVFEPVGYNATDYKHQQMGATLGIFLGKPVAMEPKDKDEDGVPDKDDKCPDLKGSIAMKGCPDTDNDGIADSDDQCPGLAGPLANNGCPYLDTDKDGVLDKDDKCPDKAGPVANNGCPYPDTDGDGILDKDDKCVNVKGFAKYNGCPVPDSDGDGVNDEMDKCPSVKGITANNGCPEIRKEVIEKVNYAAKRLQFKVGSSQLLAASYSLLNDVADLLTKNPEVKLTVEGHSSADGKYDANVKLSQARADVVKEYLESKGNFAGRINAIGYGPDRPVATGDSPQARAANRRVELILGN